MEEYEKDIMGEHEFQAEVISRLARIEENQHLMEHRVNGIEDKLDKTNEVALIAEQRGKSAHHRINGIYVIAGIIASIVSYVTGLFRH